MVFTWWNQRQTFGLKRQLRVEFKRKRSKFKSPKFEQTPHKKFVKQTRDKMKSFTELIVVGYFISVLSIHQILIPFSLHNLHLLFLTRYDIFFPMRSCNQPTTYSHFEEEKKKKKGFPL